MKIIRAEDKGFLATLCDTARQISLCINNNEEWYVYWGSESLYFDYKYGHNVFEYYFKQNYSLKENNCRVQGYTDLILLKNNSFRSTMNYILENFFVFNTSTKKILDNNLNFFINNRILGVHMRRTDKVFSAATGYQGEIKSRTPLPLNLFKQEIDGILANYDYIYLATDCKDACQFMADIYGKKLIYNKNCIRGSDNRPIHQPLPNGHDGFAGLSGYEKGLQVLGDVYYLSKCKHLIRGTSNVSLVSLYLNLELTQLNLNEKYLNDISESTLL